MVTLFGVAVPPLVTIAVGIVVLLIVFAKAASRGGPAAAVVPYLVVGAVIYAGAWAFGGLFGLSNAQLAVLVGLLLVAMYVGVSSGEQLSLPFWVTFVPLVVLALQVVFPDVVARAFTPVWRLLGVDISSTDGLKLLIISVAAVIAFWAFQFRAAEKGSNNPDSITKKILGSGRDGSKGELTKLAADYITMGRLVVAFGFALVALLLGQGGTLSAEIASFLADAPMVASNLLTAVTGFFALGGTLPAWLAWIPGLPALADALGGLGPTAFLFVALLMAGLAYGAREQLQDYRAKLARTRSKKRNLKTRVEELEDD